MLSSGKELLLVRFRKELKSEPFSFLVLDDYWLGSSLITDMMLSLPFPNESAFNSFSSLLLFLELVDLLVVLLGVLLSSESCD